MIDQLMQDRISELEQFARAEGLDLPIPALEIVRLEDQGFVIDLRTGQILEDIDIDEQIPFELRGEVTK
ncbi:MAG: hypothetical protein R3A44_10265 [Caldilineaceae bacterium]